jgi:arylsulfatase A-like enzyme
MTFLLPPKRSLLPVLLAVLLSSCGDDAPVLPVPAVQHLDLDRAEGSSAGEAILSHHEIPAEPGIWFVAGEGEKRRILDVAEPLTLEAGSPVRLGARGYYELMRVAAVDLDLEAEGAGTVRARFLSRRTGVALSTTVAFERSGRVRLPLPLPEPGGGLSRSGDALELFFEATDPAMVRVHAVDLIRRGGERKGEDRFVLLGEEARQGAWIRAGQPLVARCRAGKGSRLCFSLGLTPRLRQKDVAARLEVILSAGAEILGRTEYPLFSMEGGWHPVSLAIPDGPGREIEVRFHLGTSSGEGACALAETVVFTGPLPPPMTVLVVTSDTHRSDHLGCAPEAVEIQTPTLDALAARGTMFTDCWTPTNMTTPSHVSLFTGIHVRDHRVVNNRTPLSSRAVTLAERFREAGYATYAAVSATFLRPEVSGLGQGFDRVAWPPYGREARDAAGSIAPVLSWLPEAEGRPLFVWLHLFDAHHPYEPKGAFDRMYYPPGKDPYSEELPLPDVPAGCLDEQYPGLRDLEFPAAQYRAEITSLDAALAPLLLVPRIQAGITAFVADHGESFGERDVYFSHGGVHPANLHIPLLLAGKGVPRGMVVDDSVTHLDLGRTILDLAGLEGDDFPGRSLIGRNDEIPVRLRFAIQAGGTAASVSDPPFHLVIHLRENQAIGSARRHEKGDIELFDLETDPLCKTDIATGRSEVVERMKAELVAWLRAASGTGLAGEMVEDPELIRKLEALGYHAHEDGAQASIWWEEKDER